MLSRIPTSKPARPWQDEPIVHDWLLPIEANRTEQLIPRRTQEPDPCHGYKLRYVNPATGGQAFPTMAVFMQCLPQGYAGRTYRATDGAVFCVVL